MVMSLLCVAHQGGVSMPYRLKGKAVQVQRKSGVWQTLKTHGTVNMAKKHLKALRMMLCPRCASKNAITEQFCVYCKWEFLSGWTLCEVCNQTLKGDEVCEDCHDNDGWTSNNLNDWHSNSEDD